MASQLGQSWRDQALGTPGNPDPRRPGDPSTILAVVEGFMRNDAGFTREEVQRYVNRALQNEAGDLYVKRQQGEELLDYWEGEAAKPSPPPLARKQAQLVRSQLADEYDGGRDDFAEAVASARGSRKVILDPTTCEWVIRLDHDGRMSEAMGVNVPELFGVNPAHDPEARALLQRGGSVDYSREAAQRVRSASGKAYGPSVGREVPEAGRDTSREPTPIRKALHEVIAELHEKDARARAAEGDGMGLG